MSFLDSAVINEWMAGPSSLAILAFLSFSESAFFIIPPEVLLIPMAIANPALAIWYGIVTTISSVAGAVLGYGIGYKGGKPVLNHFFSEQKIDTVKKLFQKYDTKAIFVSAFTPIPYKVFTIAAGVFDIDFIRFIVASVIGRGSRYLLIAGAIAVFGDSIRYFLEHQFDKVMIGLTVLGVVAFVGYKVALPYVEKRILKESLASKIKRFAKKFA